MKHCVLCSELICDCDKGSFPYVWWNNGVQAERGRICPNCKNILDSHFELQEEEPLTDEPPLEKAVRNEWEALEKKQEERREKRKVEEEPEDDEFLEELKNLHPCLVKGNLYDYLGESVMSCHIDKVAAELFSKGLPVEGGVIMKGNKYKLYISVVEKVEKE